MYPGLCLSMSLGQESVVAREDQSWGVTGHSSSHTWCLPDTARAPRAKPPSWSLPGFGGQPGWLGRTVPDQLGKQDQDGAWDRWPRCQSPSLASAVALLPLREADSAVSVCRVTPMA